MKLILKWFLLSLVVLFFTGCTMYGTYMSANNPQGTYYLKGHLLTTRLVDLTPDWIVNQDHVPDYTIGPYDILNIIVWNHPELTTPTTQLSSPTDSGLLVDANGTITFPFAGTLKVSGLTIPQAQIIIARNISKYIRNPQVTVRVASFRSQEIQVMGEVGGVRTIPITDKPFSLLDALNMVGGTSLMSANTANILVVRGTLDSLTVYRLDAKSPQMMMASQKFYMKNNDIVYVPPVAITNWNRFMTQLLPTFGAVVATKVTKDTLLQ